MSAPEGGNASQKELEAELEPVLLAGRSVLVGPYEREDKVGELEIEGLRRLRIESGRPKTPEHEIADPALRFALAGTAGEERRGRWMLLNEPAEAVCDSAELLPPTHSSALPDVEPLPEGLADQIEQRLLAVHVAVERHRGDTELARHAADPEGFGTFAVG